jgi:hypothetical protein
MELADVRAVFHLADDGEEVVRFFENADRDPSAPCLDLVIPDLNF